MQELLDRRPGSPLEVVVSQCRGSFVEQQVHMALCGAARCTSAQQRTALHAAADEGRLEDVQVSTAGRCTMWAGLPAGHVCKP